MKFIRCWWRAASPPCDGAGPEVLNPGKCHAPIVVRSKPDYTGGKGGIQGTVLLETVVLAMGVSAREGHPVSRHDVRSRPAGH
jgi:hypothetical protein